ncbi:MAG: AsmA family protein [Alphaproteobacteria bacterium]|nr:AsmA family protein [Alphaproteobacteria bacterium]
MIRLIGVVLSVVVLALAGLLIAPAFMDWNAYKPQIISQIKSATGYSVQIGGDIKLALLPSPTVDIADVQIEAPLKVKSEHLAVMKRAKVSLDLWPLLERQVSVNTVRLVEPTIRLEILKDGRQGWMSPEMQTVSDAVPADVKNEAAKAVSKGASNIALQSIEIENGRFEFSDYTKNTSYLVEKINIDLSANTLNGPFTVAGDVVYLGQKIGLDANTKQINPESRDLELSAQIDMPGLNTALRYDGVVGLRSTDAQGTIDIRSGNLAKAIATFNGGKPIAALSDKVAIKGILTKTKDAISLTDSELELFKTKGSGRIEISNLISRDPVKAMIDLDVKGVLDLEALTSAPPAQKTSSLISPAYAAAAQAKAGTVVPDVLTLPMAVDGTLRLTAEGVKVSGQSLKGVVLESTKLGGRFNTAFKLLEVPGGGKLDGKVNIAYGASSVSEKTGAITYSQPMTGFTLTGASDQLPTLLASLGQKGDNTKLFNTAQFNINGDMGADRINVKNANIKLDDMTGTLSGSYRPAGQGAKPDVTLNLSMDSLNLDALKARMGGKPTPKPASSGDSQSAETSASQKVDMRSAVKPLQDFSLPVNLTFDISLGQLRSNNMDISGVRLSGVSKGSSLILNSVSADNLMGASVILKGQVANLTDLSGIDMDFYGKTSDAQALMTSLKVPTDKLPAKIGPAEAKVNLTGNPDNLHFVANIDALSGQVSAQGNLRDALGARTFGDMTFGLKHPNFVQAMKLVSPGFSGSPSLARPFDFYTKTKRIENGYDLSDIKGNFGSTSLSGALRVITGGARPDISGTLIVGQLPLDTYLANKGGAGTSSSGSGSASAGSAQKTGGSGAWSSAPLDMGWIRAADMNLDLSAQTITYGGWKFDQPKTNILTQNGVLKVQDMTAGLFGGQAGLNAEVKAGAAPGDAVSLSVKTDMKNVSIEPLVFAMSGSRRVRAQGDISMDMSVAGVGGSAQALVSALDGNARVRGQDVVFDGFDFAAISQAIMDSAKPLDRISQIVSASSSGGQTRFDTIVGDYNIDNGLVAIQTMKMDGQSANIVSQGTVSLPQKYIDTTHMITLPQAKKMQPFKVEIKGPLSNPVNTFGSGIFDTILREKVQDKVIEKLPDLLGDKTTDKLRKFGILPPQQNTAELPESEPSAPAEGQSGWSDPAQAPAPETAPEPAQQAPAPAKDPLSQILQNPDKPEEALKGVLDGLLR